MTNKFQLALTVLDRALTTKRPHLNASTVKFCAWLMKMLPKTAFTDACGNIHVDQRGNSGSKSLFVAHVDTVHRVGGKNKVIKTDKQWSASGAPLGADDGAGVALLAHMIEHRVPGYYIFTQGEEVGGIGASWLADHMPGLLRQFSRAIAFDRRATYSVITHQGMGRCASDEFGDALSDAFNKRGMLFATDDGGVYTDTAEFVDFIPECTNISAGYDMEHTERETLDMDHFMALCKAVIKIDWEALPVVRNPLAKRERVTGFYTKPRKTTRVEKDLWTEYQAQNVIAQARLVAAANEGVAKPKAKSKKRLTANDDDAFMEAMDLAMDGDVGPLVRMIAKAVDHANPAVAEKQINRRLMSESFLCELYDDSFSLELDTLLTTVFDEIATIV